MKEVQGSPSFCVRLARPFIWGSVEGAFSCIWVHPNVAISLRLVVVRDLASIGRRVRLSCGAQGVFVWIRWLVDESEGHLFVLGDRPLCLLCCQFHLFHAAFLLLSLLSVLRRRGLRGLDCIRLRRLLLIKTVVALWEHN